MKTVLIIILQFLFLTAICGNLIAAQGQTPATAAFREARDLVNSGEWAKAEASLNRFVADFPQDRDAPAALYWLAFALKQQNKFPAADTALTRLIGQFPASQWTNDARAMRVEIAPRLKNTQVIEQGVTDPNEEIKLAALQSLFEARPERAVTIASDVLKAGSGASRVMKEGALELLGDSEAVEAIPVLVQVARNDTDIRLRRKAIEALGEIESESAIEPLRALALQSADLDIARAAVEALSEFEGAARKVLLEIALSNARAELRVEAIEALGEIEDEPAVVQDLIQVMASAASAKDPALQEAVIEALAEVEAPMALMALAEFGSTSTNIEIRRRAIEGLADRVGESRDTANAVQSLIRLYDSEKDERLKEEIVEALAESDETPALRKLTQIAAGDPSLRLRRRALAAIGESDHPDAITFLEEILKKN